MAFKVSIIRPDDLLSLQIEGRNLRLDASVSNCPVVVLEDTAQEAYLIVHFPPQTITEEAVYESLSLETSPERQKTETPQEKERRLKGKNTTQSIESVLAVRPIRSRLAQPSRIVFRVPANSNLQIPYTIEGLLNWQNLELSVAGVASISDPPMPEEIANAPAITPPSDTETALEIPYRLILSPNQDVVWAHNTLPNNRGGRTELWHTRLAYRNEAQIAELSRTNPAPLRAIWSPDYVAQPSKPGPTWPNLGETDRWAGQPVLTAMNRRDRHELVILTSAFKGFVTSKNDLATYVPKPIFAEQMILSALGGWLKSRGSWEPPTEWIARPILINPLPVDPLNPILIAPLNPVPIENIPRTPGDATLIELDRSPRLKNLTSLLDPALRDRPQLLSPLRFGEPGEPLNISEWVHVATQGRDHYVRIVYEGYLYPFGHRAALIKVTERKFRDVNGTPFAYLAQRMFIVVRKPLKDYMQEESTQEVLPNEGRGMPLKQVRLTTLVTPDIDPPSPIGGTQYSFWVGVGGADFRFHATGRDSANHTVDFTATLIFVPNSDADAAVNSVRTEYNLANNGKGDRRVCLVSGQAITYANRNGDASDNTTLTTRSLFFDTDNAAKAKFLPKLDKAAVNLTAVEQLVGTSAPTEIKYFTNYVNNDFDGGNEVFAELLTKLKSEFSADKAGGIATPNLSITGVTRKLGVIAGDLTKAANNSFDPKDFFNNVAESATLFGKLKLLDLIISDGNFSNAPTIQFFPGNTPPSVKLDWKPGIQDIPANKVPGGFFEFTREPGAELKIEGLIEQPINGDAGHSSFTGKLTNFSLEFLKVIKLSFDSFSFTSETGKKTDVNVQLKPGEEALEFLGDLAFVNELKKIIPPGLFGDGPSLEITPQPAIRAGFAIGLPPVEVGVFALKDVSLGAALTLPFLDGSPLFDFNVSERQHPFNLIVAFFGGGGFFHLQLDTKAVRVVEAAFEFGAAASINLGVASGGVHIMAGIYFKLELRTIDGQDYNAATLSGYFRMGGELSVLGLISISLEFILSFTYQDSGVPNLPGKAVGRATLTVKVEVLFFSKSIEISVEKKFGGSGGDPTFAQVWDDPAIWNEYATAFA
jgi:hypothetical protein